MKRRGWGRFGRLLAALIVVGYASSLILYLALRMLLGNRYWPLALINNFALVAFLPLIGIVPLALLSRVRILIGLILILCLIALLRYGPPYLPKAYAAPVGIAVRVASLNMLFDNPHLDQVEGWIRESGADIVFLQEESSRYYQDGIQALKTQYPYQFNQARLLGNLLLSRYPLLSTENLSLEDNHSGRHQRATFEVNGQMIAVYNVHLFMPLNGDERIHQIPLLQTLSRYDEQPRNVQIRNLLKRLQSEPYPYIVAGDFNMSDQALIYSELAAQLGDSFREVGIGLGTSWPISVNGSLLRLVPPLIRIDYVWHSAQFRAVEAQQSPPVGSDHLGLVVLLDFQPTPPRQSAHASAIQ